MKPTKTLDDYQEVSRDFLLADKFRCLFDEPGVGKTGPAIMAAQTRMIELGGMYPTLITCPAYLVSNWEKEIHEFWPSAVVVRADGTGVQARREALSSYETDFIITSYANWSAKTRGNYTYPELADQIWAAYIFDEGHALRGHNSARSEHVFRVRNTRSRNKNTPIWILTGTPFVRDGGDFFPYFKLFDKKRYGSYLRFTDERCVVHQSTWSRDVGNIRKGMAAQFTEELAQFSLRRTVEEIPQLRDLEYTDTEYFVELPKTVVAMIKRAKKAYVLEHPDMASPKFLAGSGALYVEQRKLATTPPTKSNPKIEWLNDFLMDKRKTVVYTWYKSSAKAVADVLGSKAVLVTGDLDPRKRESVVAQWRDPDGPQVLVATISSLKEGISLTESRDVVFLEHSELPADNEQCIKRLCRRGQKHLVQVHHVYARASVDMAIRKVVNGRQLGINDALQKWINDDSGEEEQGSWFTGD